MAGRLTSIRSATQCAHAEADVLVQVRVLCLLALLEIGGRDGQLDALWKAFIERLAPANFGVRLAYSRTVIWAALLGALVVGGLSLWSWAFDQKAFLSAVGPELFSAGLLATVAFALSRIRRR